MNTLLSYPPGNKWWKSVTPVVGEEYRLFSKAAPWRAVFDFATLDAGDEVKLRIILSMEQGDKSWSSVSDEFRVKLQAPLDMLADKQPYLLVNDTPVSKGFILPVEPHKGPWIAALYYTQLVGYSKNVLYMTLKGD